MAATTVLEPETSDASPSVGSPITRERELPERAEAFVRLPTVRTVVANVVVVGRLKPLPLPDLDD